MLTACVINRFATVSVTENEETAKVCSTCHFK